MMSATRDVRAEVWRVVGWSNQGRPGMGDALVACALCRRWVRAHAALDRQPAATRGNDAPLCEQCNAEAHVDHADVPMSEEWRARLEAEERMRDEECHLIAVIPVAIAVAGPTSELGRYEDCPWCGMGEGTVDDCHCGMCVCGVCADQPDAAGGTCTCGQEMDADCRARDDEMWQLWTR